MISTKTDLPRAQRRSRRGSDDPFSADAMRRQSMILPDEPDMRPRGTTPRPPSIIEKHLAQGPGSFPQFGDHSFYGGGGAGASAYFGQNSFAPGEIVSMPPQAWSPVTPDSARPFYNPMGDSPMGSPVSPAPYDSFYNAQGQLVRQPSNGAGAMLNRQPSNSVGVMLNRQPSGSAQAMLNRQPSNGAGVMLNRQPLNNSPVMLNRQPSNSAAVTLNRQMPNGAGQVLYRQMSNGADAVLSRQPHHVPRGLTLQSNVAHNMILDQPHSANKEMMSPISPVPMVYVPRQAPVPVQEMQYNTSGLLSDAHYVDLARSSVSPFQAAQYAEISSKLHTLPPKPLSSPEVAAVAQEILSKPALVVTNVSEPRPLNVSPLKTGADPASPRESYGEEVEDEDDLPMPAPTFSGKSRIASTPPTLPELSNRAFSPVVLNFPSSAQSSPSPLNTTFTLPSPPPQAHVPSPFTSAKHLMAEYAPSVAARPAKDEGPAKRPDTVYTLYDDDDAYAGI